MEQIKHLKPGDKVAIVSLSLGILGEPFIEHEVILGTKRLKEFGLTPVFMPNSLKGIEFLSSHPECRADDLIQAFTDKEIVAIICAIGGTDAYKTFPYLASNEKLKTAVKENPKIFLGYSDTTNHHLILNNLGLPTFYGQAFLPDIAELADDMLPYSKKFFEMLFNPSQEYNIPASDVWYEERSDFSPKSVGTQRISHPSFGYELLQGTKNATGKLLGGCFDVFGDLLGIRNNEDKTTPAYKEKQEILNNFNILPDLNTWKNKIAFFETSNEKMSPETYKEILKKMKDVGIFNEISGLLFGMPMDMAYYDEYKQILKDELSVFDFPILINLNFGHGFPHAIIPILADAEIDINNKSLKIINNTLI